MWSYQAATEMGLPLPPDVHQNLWNECQGVRRKWENNGEGNFLRILDDSKLNKI